MRITLKVKRQRGPQEAPYWEEHTLDVDAFTSAAKLLERVAEQQENAGEQPLAWECSCMEARCGACAMLINGRPCLACDTFPAQTGTAELRVEPLSTFPVIRDLIVDRSRIFDELRQLGAWLSEEADPRAKGRELRTSANGCLACGCCLEACPNFSAQGAFSGAMAAAAAYGPLSAEPRGGQHRSSVRQQHLKGFYAGCGKSLSCQDVCPAQLPLQELISRSNAAALWRK